MPKDRAHAPHDTIPDSELTIVPDAGHLVIEERPDELRQTINTFLSATSTTRPHT